MPIISKIGRKDPKVRALHATIYAVLILGAITMVYPFLIMLSGSTKSAVDLSDFDVFPRFFRNDTILYRKHMEGLFNESVDAMNMAYGMDVRSFDAVELPQAPNRAIVEEWQSFLEGADLPSYSYGCGYLAASVSKTIPQSLREFKHDLARRYGTRIEDVNRAVGADFFGWNAFYVIPEDYLPRRSVPQDTLFMTAFWDFKAKQSPGVLYYFSPDGFYRKLFLKTQYSREIEEYNRAHGTSYESYEDIHLTRTIPASTADVHMRPQRIAALQTPGSTNVALHGGTHSRASGGRHEHEESKPGSSASVTRGTATEKEDWELFVRNTLNLLWIRVDESALRVYRRFLKAKYRSIDVLNRNYATDYASFRDIPLIEEPPFGGLALSDWGAVIRGWKDPDTGRLHMIPADALRIHSVDFMFRDYLKEKYNDITAVNEHFETDFESLVDIIPPQREAHYFAFLDERRDLRWEFATRNYKTVVEYMILHGRGIMNTAIYCTLAVLAALIVNPLAAYAMSRYRMPTTYKLLLFLLLTMAFPPIVTQIPVFLMLREFKLLNTFAALVLPGLANGYAIFLLKGFFDSLPRELFESASIDGASEWTMFWQITMSLSKPVLAVIGLQAFTIAYSNFMFALLICQDERMWTLMVWLYQLQQRSGQGVVYASLIIAAIPTFIIFVFCQNIIMRGIVVPVEK